MMPEFADLHTHTSAGDGFASPAELADRFLGYGSFSKEKALLELEPELSFLERLGHDTAEAFRMSERILEVARNLRTISKVDHNSLLGTEDFIRQLWRKNAAKQGKRFVVGTEISATHDLPVLGSYSAHLLVYFHDEEGFDILAKTYQKTEQFIDALLLDYCEFINRITDGLNDRWLNDTRERVNEHFKGRLEPITEEELLKHAKARVNNSCNPDSKINTSNQSVYLTHTDLAYLLFKRGVGETHEDVVRTYFNRDAPLFTTIVPDEKTVSLREITDVFRHTSEKSRVKCKIGLAHPGTYVRVIARQLAGADFYGSGAEKEAFIQIGNFIDELCEEGRLDFLETEYPRYAKSAEGDGEESMRKYLDFLFKERAFTNRVAAWAKQKACDKGLKSSGGSDTHQQHHTPRLGYGFGDVGLPDSYVDDLFSH